MNCCCRLHSTPISRSLFGLVAAILLSSPVGAAAHDLHAVSAVGLGGDLTCIGMSHRDPNFVMVGTSNGHIYRTLDGGGTWSLLTVSPSRTLFFGRERSPDPRMEYALGLPGKSPHLQRWLRQKGLQTSGINMQQLLVTKGDKMVSVNWIEVDWHDEKRIWVGTVDGLYLSTDRGRTFTRAFQGVTTTAERMINSVATDPHDPNVVLLGTASGLFSSKDRGTSFRKTMNYYMRDSYIREIWYDPQQKGLVHVAMGGSAMASPDGGEHWITTHWDEWGPRADVQSISLGPQNVRVIGTRDGVLASWQGGEMGSWRRAGYRFVGETILKVLATQNPKVWFALTSDALWVTADAGNNWDKYFQTGGKSIPRWIASFNGDPRHLWFITSRQIYRMGAPPRLKRVDLSMRKPQRLLDVPALHAFYKQVLQHNRLHFADLQRYRDRGPWAALLPNITAGAHWAPAGDDMHIKDYMYSSYPWSYFNSSTDRGLTFEVFANWDFTRLIFDKRKLPHWGRIARNLSGIRQDLGERVHRLYLEYKRVARILVFAPPADMLTRSTLELRLQELTAYLDAVSGGAWSKNTRGAP